MPLNLHEQCQARLLEILRQELPKGVVEKGRFLQSRSLQGLRAGDEAIPVNTRKTLIDFVSETPFSTFVYGYLSARLYVEFEYQSDLVQGLSELPGYEDIEALASHLLEQFISLPWSYSVFLRLPLEAKLKNEGDEKYPLAEGLFLVRPGPRFAERYPVTKKPESLLLFNLGLGEGPPQWEEDHYYLWIRAHGYIDDFTVTTPIDEVAILIRAFAGLGLASGVMTDREAIPFSLHELPLFVYLERDDQVILKRSHSLAGAFSDKMRTLGWTDISNVSWHDWMKFSVDRISIGLGDNERQAYLKKASQWYFDSLCGKNELLQFVQATVAIEILLGEKASSDIVGIAELLANRCAYLLAGNHDERRELMDDLKAIYDTRSAIVHRGKNRLSKVERAQLLKLQHICGRIVRKELDLLAKKK